MYCWCSVAELVVWGEVAHNHTPAPHCTVAEVIGEVGEDSSAEGSAVAKGKVKTASERELGWDE